MKKRKIFEVGQFWDLWDQLKLPGVSFDLLHFSSKIYGFEVEAWEMNALHLKSTEIIDLKSLFNHI